MKPASGRRQAQRTIPAPWCQNCLSKRLPQRHHVDGDPTNNDPENVEILCQACHTAIHRADGTWGHGNVKPAECAVCGRTFQPRRTSRSTLCGRMECAREFGRRAAIRPRRAVA